MSHILKRTLITLAGAFFIMGVITTPGAVATTYFAKEFNTSLHTMLLYYALSLVFAVVGYFYQREVEYKASRGLASILAIVFFYLIAMFSTCETGDDKFEKHEGIWLYKKRQKVEDCFGSRECKTYQINDVGLRSTPGDGDGRLENNVVLLGDSFIFGSGVDDDKTVAAQMNKMFADNHKNIAVINGGMAGFGLASMVKMARFVKNTYDPDVFMLYLKNDDISEVDTSTRIDDAKNTFTGKLLVSMNLEFVLEILRLKNDFSRTEYQFENDLKILSDIAGKRLFIVTLLSDDYFRRFVQWLKHHPDTGWLDGRLSSEWQQAEIIEGDGHWNDEGSLRIAKVLVEHVEDILDNKISQSKVVDVVEQQPDGDEYALQRSWVKPDLSGLVSKRFKLKHDVSKDVPRSLDLTLQDKDDRVLHLRVYWCNKFGYLEKSFELCFSLNPDYKYAEDQISWVKELIKENTPFLKKISTDYLKQIPTDNKKTAP